MSPHRGFRRDFHPGPVGRDLSKQIKDEIRFHLEMRTQELIDTGVAPGEAWRAALEAFGDPQDIVKRTRREAGLGNGTRRRGRLMASFIGDLRYGLRMLTGNPGFSVIVILTLALGIGANTAIYSIANAALFRAPPVREPGELAAVYTTSRRGFPRSSSSYLDYLDYRERSTYFADMAATATLSAGLGDEELGARFSTVEAVTGNYFDLLGLTPALGRLIQPEDDRLEAGVPVVVLSHAFWQDHFQADADIVGRTVRLNGSPFTVAGVGPVGFAGMSLSVRPDLWIPMRAGTSLGTGSIADPRVWEERAYRWIGRLIARLQPGSSVEQARAEMLAISAQLAEEDPEARGPRSVTVDALPGYALPVGSEAQMTGFVWLLLGVVGLTLLLACANVANLLVARASSRAREVGVRLAIGAGRGRLMRQLLTESMVLALLGGAAGLAVAWAVLALMGGLQLPGGVSIGMLDIGLDRGMLAVTLIISLVTGVVFGLAPALHATRPDLVGALKGEARLRGLGRGLGLRKSLVAIQVALCLVVLAGSGLFLRTLQRGLSADLGIGLDNVALARFPLAQLQYSPEQAMAFTDALKERASGLPGVTAAALSTRVPLQAGGAIGFFFEVDGYQPRPDEELRMDVVFVTPGYFESLGLPLNEGRVISASDDEGSPNVMVVSQTMASAYWPDGLAVGGTVRTGGEVVEVIGVVDDVTWNTLADDPTDYVFVPLAQWSSRAASSFLTLSVRTTGDARSLLPLIRSEVGALERDLPITTLQTMEDQVARVLTTQRMGAVLLSAFGVLALILAGVGIAGVVAYSVSRQRRDIGVRIALGAADTDIFSMVVKGMGGPILIGLGGGLGLALSLARTMEGFLFQVSATDPLTFLAISAGLATVAVLATIIPARQATRVDPLTVLKAE
ncbi:MAG: ABC transporter permease [Gemmatimonadota bacterium]|nr:MAG: ABC transporter permease [Gemmatimonadota bacterium]